MTGTPQARQAVRSSLIIRGIFLLILLMGIAGALLVYPLPAALIVAALVVGAALPLAIALPLVSRRQKRWIQQAEQAYPDASIIRTDWNGVFMPSFVKDPAVIQDADPRGFVVIIAAGRRGLTLWRGALRDLVPLGTLTWSEITDVHMGEVKPLIGMKAPSIQITFDDGARMLSSPIELIVRGEPTSQALDRILAAREPDQDPHDR
jgi:hypothetical protein